MLRELRRIVPLLLALAPGCGAQKPEPHSTRIPSAADIPIPGAFPTGGPPTYPDGGPMPAHP